MYPDPWEDLKSREPLILYPIQLLGLGTLNLRGIYLLHPPRGLGKGLCFLWTNQLPQASYKLWAPNCGLSAWGDHVVGCRASLLRSENHSHNISKATFTELTRNPLPNMRLTLNQTPKEGKNLVISKFAKGGYPPHSKVRYSSVSQEGFLLCWGM